MSLYSCFNSTETTEIYTYVHTLSLLIARPIWQQSDRGSVARRHDAAVPRETAEQPIALKPSKIGVARKNEVDGDIVGRRSEEHTSELQSLMRISYAVFCLKKTLTILSITQRPRII